MPTTPGAAPTHKDLDNLFKRWRDTYEEGARFAPDGIISPDDYSRARLKILFVLKETNDYGGDLREWCQRPGRPKGQTWCNLARWASGLLNGFPAYEEVDHIKRGEVRAVLRSVAVLNLKKLTGGSSTDMDALHEAACRDQRFIREEVSIINPDVLVCCGVRAPMVWLYGLETERFAQVPVRNSFYEVRGARAEDGGRVFLFTRHPARTDNKAAYEVLARAWGKVVERAWLPPGV